MHHGICDENPDVYVECRPWTVYTPLPVHSPAVRRDPPYRLTQALFVGGTACVKNKSSSMKILVHNGLVPFM